MNDLILACPHCGRRNRVRLERLNDAPSCGSCSKAVTAGAPLVLDDASFGAFSAASDRPLVVDFWAAWCGPCRGFAPVFAASAARHPELVFVKIDTDANPQLSAQLAIRSIPTLALFRGGQLVQRVSGALPALQFEQWLQQAVTAA